MCAFVEIFRNRGIQLRYLHNNILIPQQLALTSESRVKRETLSLVQLIGFVVLLLAQVIHADLNLHMARRARADAAAVVLEIDTIRECYIKDIITNECFAGDIHREERDLRHVKK